MRLKPSRTGQKGWKVPKAFQVRGSARCPSSGGVSGAGSLALGVLWGGAVPRVRSRVFKHLSEEVPLTMHQILPQSLVLRSRPSGNGIHQPTLTFTPFVPRRDLFLGLWRPNSKGRASNAQRKILPALSKPVLGGTFIGLAVKSLEHSEEG